MGTTLEFRVLGPVEAIANSVPLELGGPKQRALLALLLLRANEVVPRDRLIDELWGDSPPVAARDTVKVYVGRLRKIIEQDGSSERLRTRGGGYVLRVEPDELDLRRFEHLVEEGSRALANGEAETAASVLQEALALWHGPALVDLGEVPFARAEQARLEELRLAAVEERIDADLALGRSSALVPELRQLTLEHPYRERLHRQLMLALYRAGRQAEALSAYQDARKTLVEQLGLEPSNELRDLEKAVLAHDPVLETPHSEADEPSAVAARVPTRMRRRPLLMIGAAALVVAVAAIGAALHTRADSTLKIEPNSVAIIDPDSNKLVGAIHVGRAPGHVATGNGRVWVASNEDRTLTEIDPIRKATRSTINLDGVPEALTASPNFLWVITRGSRTELARIDPKYRQIGTEVPIGPATTGPSRQPLAFGRSTIWAPGSTAGTLVRRDPTTLAERGTVELHATPLAAAADADDVWVTTSDNRLLDIDSNTGDLIESLTTGGRPRDVAIGGHAVWIASWSDDLVVRWDPATHSSNSISVGDAPTAVTYGHGSVWVACGGDGTVWRIDPRTRKIVKHWALGASPEDIAAGEGAVWIAVYSPLPP